MQEDFHYYATYCAAYLAGYTHEESLKICYSAQFVDLCTVSFLSGIKAPLSAATTQLQLEMMDARTDIIGLQDITRIWSAFHFLPYDLHAEVKGGHLYREKYRLICNPNGELVTETVNLAKKTGTLEAAGIAMHVLADTWAHRYFAGTPSLVINNTNYYFYELLDRDGREVEKLINFRHNPTTPDDLQKGLYTNSIYNYNENSIMNLGHGRAGHLPDYCFIKYKYMPAWGRYEVIIKDNQKDYYNAFCQMIYALKTLRDVDKVFETDVYDTDAVAEIEDGIRRILAKRQLNACEDWKALGERLSGMEIETFDIEKFKNEYKNAHEFDKNDTYLGRFIFHAIRHKNMVADKIYESGNRLAGIRKIPKTVKKILQGGAG